MQVEIKERDYYEAMQIRERFGRDVLRGSHTYDPIELVAFAIAIIRSGAGSLRAGGIP